MEFELPKSQESIALIRFKTGHKIQSEEQVLWVKSQKNSATLLLIKEIFDRHKDLSFFILRNRILTTEDPTPFLKGLVKVTAKRISFNQDLEALNNICRQFPNGQIPTDFSVKSIFNQEPNWHPPTESITHARAFKILGEMQSLLPRSEILHNNPFPVTCLITDENLKVISWGFNSNAVNKIYHAEFNAIQRLSYPVPKGAKFFVTHKPCQMCTGFIYDHAVDSNKVEILFAVNPPGCRSQNTILDTQSFWKPEYKKLIPFA